MKKISVAYAENLGQINMPTQNIGLENKFQMVRLFMPHAKKKKLPGPMLHFPTKNGNSFYVPIRDKR